MWGNFFSSFASTVIFWASEMPCEQNSKKCDTVCRRGAMTAYFFSSNTLENASDAWFSVFKMLCCFVPRCQMAVSKHTHELGNFSVDQADKGGDRVWGFLWVWGFFFVQKIFMYYHEEAKQIASWIFSFHFSLVHITYQCFRITGWQHLILRFFFFLEPQNPYLKIKNL